MNVDCRTRLNRDTHVVVYYLTSFDKLLVLQERSCALHPPLHEIVSCIVAEASHFPSRDFRSLVHFITSSQILSDFLS